MMRAFVLLLLPVVAAPGLDGADFEPAQLVRLHPLGGQIGTSVELEILGTHLDSATYPANLCPHLCSGEFAEFGGDLSEAIGEAIEHGH